MRKNKFIDIITEIEKKYDGQIVEILNNAKIKSGTGVCCQKGETKKSEYNSSQPCADGQKGNP